MAVSGNKEGLNVPKSTLSSFFEDLEGKLALMTGLVDMESLGLTLEQVRKPLLCVRLPGIGKTCGIVSIVKKLNTQLPAGKKLSFKKILLGQTVVGSLSGIPVVKPDGNVVRVQMPDLPDVKRDGEYGVLFLDEITTADEAQVQPALGLCDDTRNIGEYTLPEHWLVVAAGNGPDCSNFLRLDDMTISRFTVYDIAYDYKRDWRQWAHENDIDSKIIAFLNFAPETCVRVESNDMHKAGKLFPCPRTWERLSNELKMRAAMNREVTQAELPNFAGRIVGQSAGREYAAFCAYSQTVKYDPEKIINGTENMPKQMPAQEFHILLQALIKRANSFADPEYISTGKNSLATAQKVSNMIKWLIAFEKFDLEKCVNAIQEIRSQTKGVRAILGDSDFDSVCPEFIDFMDRNSSWFMSHLDDFNFG